VFIRELPLSRRSRLGRSNQGSERLIETMQLQHRWT
jgi:hypothetical protein